MKMTFGIESWPLKSEFVLATGPISVVELVVVSIRDGEHYGRGECQPEESAGLVVSKVVSQLESVREQVEAGASRQELLTLLPAGPARNAIDCALWDLEAKKAGVSTIELAGLPSVETVTTDFTISLDTPEAMAQRAQSYRSWPILKLNLRGDADDLDRVDAVRAVNPTCELVVDLNGGWTLEQLDALAPQLAKRGIIIIEQPLPVGEDSALTGRELAVPLCADESCTDRQALNAIAGRYQYVRISLDRAGGLTAAIELAHAAAERNIGVIVGASIGTSLSIAPATLLGGLAAHADLDGVLLLASDRKNAIHYDEWRVFPPTAQLWG